MVEGPGPAQATAWLTESLKKKDLHPTDFSLRELAEAYMGFEWVDNLHPKRGRYYSGRELQEADASAVSYSSFSNITGQIFFTMVMERYTDEDLVFSKIIPVRPTTILDMEKYPGISDVGDEFSVIGENNEYPNFGVSEDWIERSALEKRGGIVPVSKEAVFGDKTSVLLERCRNLGWYLGLNKEKRLIDAVVDENAGAKSAALGGHRYHWKGTTYATYQATTPWINVATSNGLASWVQLETAWLKLVQITDPYTGEPILIKPKHVVVTPQNMMTLWRILHATDVRTHHGGYATSGQLQDTAAPSPIAQAMGNLTPVTSQLLASRQATDTDWQLGDLSKAFGYASAWDVLTEEAPANSPENFRRDIVMQFRASEMGAAFTQNPRFMVESRA